MFSRMKGTVLNRFFTSLKWGLRAMQNFVLHGGKKDVFLWSKNHVR